MARSTYMSQKEAYRVIEDFHGRLSECTFAPKGALFTCSAIEGEELRRALDTVLLFSDGKCLLTEQMQNKIRRALNYAADDLMEDIADLVFEAVEEAL